MPEIVTRSELQQRVEAARRVRAAVGLAATALLTLVSGCLYRFQLRDNPYGIQAIIVMGLVGIVLLNVGGASKSRRVTEFAILKFYTRFRFYGAVVSVSAALVFIYALTLRQSQSVQGRERPVPQPTQVSTPETVPSVAVPPEFPELEVSGIILNGESSSAIINRKYVQVGEMIDGVRVVEIGERSVLVELDGSTKRISRFTQPTVPTGKGGSTR